MDSSAAPSSSLSNNEVEGDEHLMGVLRLKEEQENGHQQHDPDLSIDAPLPITPPEASHLEEQPLDVNTTSKSRFGALKPFVIISTSYLLFTITDGAIRMIVLLHAYNKGFTAWEVAIMFTLYELAGVFTNLLAGFMGSKWGIKTTLLTGLSFQILSYGMMFGWDEGWGKQKAIIYVTIAQMFAGIAKDLTKLGGKTVTKLVTPEEQQTNLFRLVSFITGFKNSMKGVGYFVGSALLNVSYRLSLGVMMILIGLAFPWAILGLNRNLGTAKKKSAKSWKEVWAFDNRNLNYLSLARLFLFASRDFWFEVPLPFYLRSPGCGGLGIDFSCNVNKDCTYGAICDLSKNLSGTGICINGSLGGGCGGLGLNRAIVGAVLGGYIVLYGQVQSWTPQLVTGPLKQTPPNKLTEVLWGVINCIPTLVLTLVIALSPSFKSETHDQKEMIAWLISLIVLFAVIFAINSSIHSYLVVKYAKEDKVAVSVGFYYMSNAVGRLVGTLGSGVLYTFVGRNKGMYAGTDSTSGLAACFLAGTLSSLLAAIITLWIDDQGKGLKCGPCITLVPNKSLEEDDDVIIEAGGD